LFVERPGLSPRANSRSDCDTIESRHVGIALEAMRRNA
jgi:hypothetical protein